MIEMVGSETVAPVVPAPPVDLTPLVWSVLPPSGLFGVCTWLRFEAAGICVWGGGLACLTGVIDLFSARDNTDDFSRERSLG